MGQEYSVTCPVCKTNKAVYRDIFRAECLDIEKYLKYNSSCMEMLFNDNIENNVNLPPFENFLGPKCLKYMEKRCPVHLNREEGYVSWTFYACEDCIFIDDINRNEKFTEYNPSGIKAWRSMLP